MKPPPLDGDEVIRQLRWLLENGWEIKPGHFRDELEAAGASMADIYQIVRDDPKVVEGRWDPRRRRHNYTIAGVDLDGDT